MTQEKHTIHFNFVDETNAKQLKKVSEKLQIASQQPVNQVNLVAPMSSGTGKVSNIINNTMMGLAIASAGLRSKMPRGLGKSVGKGIGKGVGNANIQEFTSGFKSNFPKINVTNTLLRKFKSSQIKLLKPKSFRLNIRRLGRKIMPRGKLLGKKSVAPAEIKQSVLARPTGFRNRQIKRGKSPRQQKPLLKKHVKPISRDIQPKSISPSKQIQQNEIRLMQKLKNRQIKRRRSPRKQKALLKKHVKPKHQQATDLETLSAIEDVNIHSENIGLSTEGRKLLNQKHANLLDRFYGKQINLSEIKSHTSLDALDDSLDNLRDTGGVR